MADYPASLPSFAASGANLSTNPHSALHTDLNNELLAVCTELGTAPSGTDTTVKARLDRITPTLGALTNWTPIITQGATVASTTNRATYQRVGRHIWASYFVTMTATGAGANTVFISTPPPAAAYSFGNAGTATLFDTSASAYYPGLMYFASSTALSIHTTLIASATPTLGVVSFTAALASGDILSGTFSYEAAAD